MAMTITDSAMKMNGTTARWARHRASMTITASTAPNSNTIPANSRSRTLHGGVNSIASVSGLMAMPNTLRPASAGAMARQPVSGMMANAPPSPSHITSPRQHSSPPA